MKWLIPIVFPLFALPAFATNVIAPVLNAATNNFSGQSGQQFIRAKSNAKNPVLLLSKIEAMQKEIQQLRGQLEVQAHDLKLLQEQQQIFYKDLEERINNKQATSAPIASKLPQRNVSAAQAKPRAPKDANDEGSYTASFELLIQKDYPNAIRAMQHFLLDYPDSPYASNARYWLGDLFLMQGQVNDAVKEFSAVVTQYPHSNKTAGAHLKLGFAYYDLGKWHQARHELSIVKNKFPDTALAQLALARLRDMDEQGLQ